MSERCWTCKPSLPDSCGVDAFNGYIYLGPTNITGSISTAVGVPGGGPYRLAYWLTNYNGIPNSWQAIIQPLTGPTFPSIIVDSLSNATIPSYVARTRQFVLPPGTVSIRLTFQARLDVSSSTCRPLPHDALSNALLSALAITKEGSLWLTSCLPHICPHFISFLISAFLQRSVFWSFPLVSVLFKHSQLQKLAFSKEQNVVVALGVLSPRRVPPPHFQTIALDSCAYQQNVAKQLASSRLCELAEGHVSCPGSASSTG